MIGRVYRGHGTAGLIRYLYGLARQESPVAHHDPHLVASWLGHTPAVLAALEPVPLATGTLADSPEDARVLMSAGGRGLSAGAARAAAQLAAAGSQGSVWDAPGAPVGAGHGADGTRKGESRRPAAVPGPVDARHLVRALEAPLREQQRAAKHGGPAPTAEHVWHVALRNADHDRRLSDAEWAQVAADVVHRTGLSPSGPDGRRAEGGCPWVAVRHDDSSIHLVVVLAREDGKGVRLWRDYRQLRDACRAAERAYGLTVTAPADRTAATHTTRAEREKAARLARTSPAPHGSANTFERSESEAADGVDEQTGVPGRGTSDLYPAMGEPRAGAGAVEPRAAREELRRHVQAVAAASANEQQFWERLAAGGVLLKVRTSVRNPEEVTGYAVALPVAGPTAEPAAMGARTTSQLTDDLAAGAGRTAAGAPVFFGGGRLAPDLTLPQLRRRWLSRTPPAEGVRLALPVAAAPDGTRPSVGGPVQAAWRYATVASENARGIVTAALQPGAGPDARVAANDAAWAAADLLAVAARLVDGPAGRGPLSDTAIAYDRAARPGQQSRTAQTPRHQQSVDEPSRRWGRSGGSGIAGLRQAAVLLGGAGLPKDDVALVLRLFTQVVLLIEAVQQLREAQQHAAQAAAARAAVRHAQLAVDQLGAVQARATARGRKLAGSQTVPGRRAWASRAMGSQPTAARLATPPLNPAPVLPSTGAPGRRR